MRFEDDSVYIFNYKGNGDISSKGLINYNCNGYYSNSFYSLANGGDSLVSVYSNKNVAIDSGCLSVQFFESAFSFGVNEHFQLNLNYALE